MKKEIDFDLFINYITEGILELWVDKYSLRFDKLIKQPFFENKITPDSADKLMRAKLAVTVGFAIHSIELNQDVDFRADFIKAAAKEAGSVDMWGTEQEFSVLLKKYACYVPDAFSEFGNRDGGKEIEAMFSELAFGGQPDSNDTNANYALYKVLSKYQRAVMRVAQRAFASAKV